VSWLDRNLPQENRAEEAVLQKAADLDPTDHSEHAEYLREVAEDIQDQRGRR
jgi:hypothetical protein